MRKFLILGMTLLVGLTLFGCSKNSSTQSSTDAAPATQGKNISAATPTEIPQTTKTPKILIAYFSKTGNTQEVAKQIQTIVGGDLFEIATQEPYPTEYRPTVDQAKKEQETNFRPQLSTTVQNLESYDIVYLGYPNWWGTMPMPVFTFMESYNFSGKTIVPFCTHEGSRLGRSVTDIRSLAPQANVLEGLAIRGSDAKSSQNEVTNWLRQNNLVK